jgi:DNA/RNA-binding domain of Phe-tRNA-synthetase-like protein
VREDTENVLLYADAVLGIEKAYLQDGLTIVADILVKFGRGKIELIDVY